MLLLYYYLFLSWKFQFVKYNYYIIIKLLLWDLQTLLLSLNFIFYEFYQKNYWKSCGYVMNICKTKYINNDGAAN